MFGFVSAGASLVTSGASSAGRFLFGKVRNVSEALIGEPDTESRTETDNADSDLFEDGIPYSTDIDTLVGDRFQFPQTQCMEAQTDTEETFLKEVNVLGNTKSINEARPYEISDGRTPAFDTLLADDDCTSLLGQNNIFSTTKPNEDSSSNRQKGRTPKKKQKLKKKHKQIQHKRKLQDDEESINSEDDINGPPAGLWNIQKDGRGPGSTSDYVSQASEEPEEVPHFPFQRNSEARISNLYKWNSVSGLVDPGKDRRKFFPPYVPRQSTFLSEQSTFKPEHRHHDSQQCGSNQPQWGTYMPQYVPQQEQFVPQHPQFGPSMPPFEPYLPQFGRQQTQFGQHQTQFGPNMPYFEPNLPQFGRQQTPFGEQQNQSYPQQLTVKNINNAIFSPGSGDGNTSTIVSTNSTEWDIIKERVEAQTEETISALKRSGPVVETEGFIAAKQLAIDVSKRNKPVIVLGRGDGVTTIVNQLLVDLCSSSNSSSNTDEIHPYVVHEPNDWMAVDKDEPAVVAVHDPSGTIQTDLKLLNDMLRPIEQCLSANSNVTVLVAMRKFPDFDDSVIKKSYRGHVIDLQSQEHLISENSMKTLFESAMTRCHVKYENGNNKKMDRSNARLIGTETVREIIRQADKRGFAKDLIEFFECNISEGVTAFTQPDISIVKHIDAMCQSKDPGFYALLAVHDYGGELSMERVEQIRRLHMTNKHSWSVLKLFNTNDARGYNYRPPIPKESLAMKFAKVNKCPDQLGDILQDGMEQQRQQLLEEVNNVYRFRSGKVRTSLLLVLAKEFPEETMVSCDESFVSQYVRPRSAGKGCPSDLYVPVESNRNCGVKKPLLKRLTDDILQRKISMYTNHPLFRESWFVEELFTYWTQTKGLLWKVLHQQQSTLEPYCLLYFGLDQTFTDPSRDGANNVAEKVLKQGKWKSKRRVKSKYAEWAQSQEHETMLRAIELGRHSTVRLLADMGVKITKEMLWIAIRLAQTDILKLFKEVGTFTDTEWWDALMYSFEIFSQDESSESSLEIFKELTDKANAKSIGGTVQPLIQYAVATNDQKLTDLICSLSSQKIRINIISAEGDTALNIATRNGNEALVKTLLEAGSKQINQGNVTRLPVHEASERGNVNVLKMLISNEPEVLNLKDPDGRTPLHIATEHGHVPAVRELLGIDGIQVNCNDSTKQTALHVAAKLGHEFIVKMLLETNADVALLDTNEETALSLAVRNSEYECVKALLKGQADKALEQDSMPIFRAVFQSDFKMLDILISDGYNLDTTDKKFGTPLLQAMLNDNPEMAQFLLEKGANVHQSIGGRQPILWAALKCDNLMFELLRRFGANIMVVDEHTLDSVVHNVVKANNEDLTVGILSLPESAGLVDMKNWNGDTAVHLACREGESLKIIEHLLSANFSKSLPNKKAEHPIMIVEARRSNAVKGKNRAEYQHCSKLSQILRTPKTY